MKRKLFILALLCLLSTGCAEKHYLEKMSLVTGVALDEGEGSSIKGTFSILQFDPASPNISHIITGENDTAKGIRIDADYEASHKIVAGQLRTVIYSKALAEKGLLSLLDTLMRDPKITDLLYLSVAREEASEVLQPEHIEGSPTPGNYIERLIEKNVENEQLPDANLHQFTHDLYDIGIDPVLPLLEVEDEKTKVSSVALFHEDRMIGTLDPEMMFYLLLLKNPYRKGKLQLTLDSEEFRKYIREEAYDANKNEPFQIALEQIRSSADFSSEKGDPTKQTVNVKIKQRLVESSLQLKYEDDTLIKKLEAAIEEKMVKNLEEFMEVLKENETDPVGFGKRYRAAHGKDLLTKEEWRSLIEELDVTFTVETELLRYGITD